jgi:hypothetical protein
MAVKRKVVKRMVVKLHGDETELWINCMVMKLNDGQIAWWSNFMVDSNSV